MPSTSQKIIIVGLSEAGKTSIVKSFLHEYHLIADLSPTKGVERNEFSFLGNKIYTWDFGGQQKYREGYLNSPDVYFTKVEIAYYVVDVQDIKDFDESTVYFNSFYRELLKFSPDARLYILFHKSDPDYDISVHNIPEKFKHQIKEIVSKKLPIAGYSLTSIHKPLHLINVISKPLLEEVNLSDKCNDILEKFCEKYDFEFAILFTKDYFILGYYGTNQISLGIVNPILTTYFGKLVNKLDKNNFYFDYNNYQISSNKMKLENNNDINFHLLTGYDPKKIIIEKEEFLKLTREFKDNLKMLLSSTNILKYVN